LPVDAKSLFRVDVLRPLLAKYVLPHRVEQGRDKLVHWANLIGSGRIDSFKKREILLDFLTYIYTDPIEPMRARAAEALARERQIRDLVNAAYGFTPVALMWRTAPPRMPFDAN